MGSFHEVSMIAGYLLSSRQDLDGEHAALAADRALPQWESSEFLIAVAVIPGNFRSRRHERRHVQQLAATRQFSLPVASAEEP